MKILTYNINGLKSFYKKGLLDKLFDDFYDVDIFCFQEVKADYKTVTKILDKYSDYNIYDKRLFTKISKLNFYDSYINNIYEIVDTFLNTKTSEEERHHKRVQKIINNENGEYNEL